MSTCPTCQKPNCGNWAACARKATLMGASEADAYAAELIWYGIGVAETLFQVGMRMKEPVFVEVLALHGSAGVRRMLFTQTIKELDVHLIRKAVRG